MTRRIRSLHFGDMEGKNVPFHREHRSKHGRQKNALRKRLIPVEPKSETEQSLAQKRSQRLIDAGMELSIVKPHTNVSRECVVKDMKRIERDAFVMIGLFGVHTVALSHAQATQKDPLRFFVLATNLVPLLSGKSSVIVNPRIVRHSSYMVDSGEGCATYPGKESVIKQRWRKCLVEYQVLGIDNVLSEVHRDQPTGLMAYVFQHEIDHMDGKYCYD